LHGELVLSILGSDMALGHGRYDGMTVRRTLGFVARVLLLLVVFGGGWLTGRMGIGSVVDPASLTELERAFAERMRGVSLVGSYTVSGREDGAPRTDRYDIESVEKVGEDLWRFNASMTCCGLDGSVIPIVVPMRWNGDTPMIMMTETGLPGIGAFTVRLFFYEDRYAGTWQHGDVGGHMSGRIEKQTSATPQ
jgi:hypothetical protein